MTAMLAVDLIAQASDTADSIEDALGVVQTILEFAGTVAFALSAALVAGHKRMNVVGVVVFSVLVAAGGGTLRDVLLGDLPVYWVDDPATLIVAAATAALTIPLFDLGTISVFQRHGLVQLFDSVGLALFVDIGTDVALDAGGGIIRDNLADEVPQVLAAGHFYASAAVAGSALNIALLETSLRPAFGSAIAATFIFSARMLSIHYGWGVPKFRIDDDQET